ncbi:MAG: hypothetical protein GXO55_10765 [Chloroflexi bacterium]|nr:hypothetical protein [Chloroflexota bacterium]
MKSSLQRFLDQLPGVAGYRRKETRREVDKRIRQQLMEELEHVRRSLSDLQLSVLSRGGLRWMNELERIHSRLTLLTDKIRSAAYGYRPLFDVEQVEESQLDALIRFDRDMLARVETLKEQLQPLREKAQLSGEAFSQALRTFYQTLTDLLDTYNRRDALIRGEVLETREELPEEPTDQTKETKE